MIMTKEEKELLLKDLCARLPYAVKLGFYASATKQTYVCTLLGLEPEEEEPIIAKTENGSFYMLAGNVKPYLFPMSSMTDKELIEFFQIRGMNLNTYELRTFRRRDIAIASTLSSYSRNIDWLNAHHFDYRGLIEKGLAIDASGLNIY